MKLAELAGGFELRVLRDADFESLGFIVHSKFKMLVFLENVAFLDALVANADVALVITTEALAEVVPTRLGIAIARSPRKVFYEIHNHLVRHTTFYGRRRAATIAPTAVVHPAAFVADENVTIGAGVVIEPRAVVLSGVTIEDGVVIRAGAVVGSEGFQVSTVDGRALRVAHAGGVTLRSHVEVQANTCIDRALFGGQTEIGEESSIDDLVYVAHEVITGKACRIGAGAIIAGGVRLGDRVWIGPNATVSSQLSVGADAVVSLGAVVTRNVPAGGHVTGNFAIGHDRFLSFLRGIR